MREDSGLLAMVFAVWAVLATLYGVVPQFHLPGSTLVWGGGAAIFLILVVAIAAAERRR
jgi:uncharacterized BrkB/YihY/UPF0761 family membrane protein